MYESIKEKVFEKINNVERFNHSLRVVEMALFLNKRFNFQVDEEKIKLAGILHDYAKEMSFEESVKYLEKHLTLVEIVKAKRSPAVLHSIVGYYLVQEELNITDEEILKAILNHTTGNANMSKLEELIFVSDAVEETRTYNGVEKIREKVLDDFYMGMLYMIEETLKHLKEKNWYINPKTIETYEYYCGRIKKI